LNDKKLKNAIIYRIIDFKTLITIKTFNIVISIADLRITVIISMMMTFCTCNAENLKMKKLDKKMKLWIHGGDQESWIFRQKLKLLKKNW